LEKTRCGAHGTDVVELGGIEPPSIRH